MVHVMSTGSSRCRCLMSVSCANGLWHAFRVPESDPQQLGVFHLTWRKAFRNPSPNKMTSKIEVSKTPNLVR